MSGALVSCLFLFFILVFRIFFQLSLSALVGCLGAITEITAGNQDLIARHCRRHYNQSRSHQITIRGVMHVGKGSVGAKSGLNMGSSSLWIIWWANYWALGLLLCQNEEKLCEENTSCEEAFMQASGITQRPMSPPPPLGCVEYNYTEANICMHPSSCMSLYSPHPGNSLN